MYGWKAEHGGGVESHRLYVGGIRTGVFVMRRNGMSGPWVVRDGINELLERRALPHAKVACLKLLEG